MKKNLFLVSLLALTLQVSLCQTTVRIEDTDAGTVSYDGSLKSYSAADNGTAINLSNDPGKQIVWSYSASSSGSYTLTFRYTRKASMSPLADIYVNSSLAVNDMSFAETSSNAFSTQSITVSLASGTNTIMLETVEDQEFADIDWIEITGGSSGGTTYTLTTSASPSNGGSVSGAGTYASGTVVTVTASPASGYTFSNWSGDASGSSTSVNVTMNSNKSVTAVFSTSGGNPNPGVDYSLVGYGAGTTGGANGVSVTCSTGDCILDAIDDKVDGVISQPLTIYVNGTITPSNTSDTKIALKDLDDVSVIGVGTSGVFNGIGLKIWRASNIIIRNVTVHHVDIGDKDAIGIEGPADHIWIDHCELYATYQGVDKDYYDGLLDAKADAEYITYSYNYMHDSWKMMLVGSSDSDSDDRKITIHHNYFDNVNSRMPLYRFGTGHVFNNYYSGVESTGINSRMGACLRVENNYFQDAQNPIVSAYSSSLGGVDESGSIYDNVTWDLSASDVNAPLNCTLSVPYSYSSYLHSTSSVPSIVVANAGVGKISASSSNMATRSVVDNALVLYPVPSENEMTVLFEGYTGAETIRIVNLYGREMMEVPATGVSTTLDISSLPVGTYVLQLHTRGASALRMFVKR